MLIDYHNPALGSQHTGLFSLEKEFVTEFSQARTFCFLHEVEMLRDKGLIKGGIGPLGNGFLNAKRPAETLSFLMIAGGIGIAPLRFLIEKVILSCRQVVVLQGATTATKLYPKELLPPGVSIAVATEDGTTGHKGLITELVRSFTTTADEIFVCGPMPMLRYMADNRKFLKLTDKPVYISLEMPWLAG